MANPRRSWKDKSSLLLTVLILMLGVSSAGCNARTPEDSATVPVEGRMDVTPLPPPRLEGGMCLERALESRRSMRSFASSEPTPEQIGQLLWAAQGVTNSRGYRTAPSAGALYPLELYLVDGSGIFRYLPEEHSLMPIARGDRKDSLYKAALEQEAVLQAPITLVITGVYERTAVKYGDRARRYVHLEAGHVAQNILLQAVSLGLGAVPIGAFRDQEVQSSLELPADHQPLYLIPIGEPR